MSEAERQRELAEAIRVVQEHGRVVAEETEVSGRVAAEEGRVIAEKGRAAAHQEYQNELERLRDDPAHYMTPGARKYFRRVAIGYIILAVATVFGIKAVSDRSDNQLRNDINAYAHQSCLGSIPTLNKFNNLIELNIESNRGAREIALREGDDARVRLTTQNIIKLQESKLRVPNAKECSAPILK